MSTWLARNSKVFVWPIGIALAVGLVFTDNIRGYYRFKDICKNDSGLRIYDPLQKNQGWLAMGKADAAYLLHYYGEISYVRYFDSKESLQDLVRTDNKRDSSDDGFRAKPIESDRQPRYEYRDEFNRVPEEARMNRYTSTVKIIENGKLAVTYQDFTYRLFNPDWGGTGGTACSTLNRADINRGSNDSKEIAIHTGFMK